METYRSPEAQAEALAEQVATELAQILTDRPSASLAVAGGSTPAMFFEKLSHRVLDWERVHVTTTDERIVDEKSDRSNAKMVQETLIQNKAAKAHFLPLHVPVDGNDKDIIKLEQRVNPLLPLDVCVLGMGDDMHIASLFPDADETAAAISQDCKTILAKVHPSSASEPRLSLTGPVLSASQNLHLLITGHKKLIALEKAKEIENIAKAPARLIFQHRSYKIHYADKQR